MFFLRKFFDEFGQDFVKVAYKAVMRDIEYGSGGIGVYRDYAVGVFHARRKLNGAADTDGYYKFGLDGSARKPYLTLGVKPAEFDYRASSGYFSAEQVGEAANKLKIFFFLYLEEKDKMIRELKNFLLTYNNYFSFA